MWQPSKAMISWAAVVVGLVLELGLLVWLVLQLLCHHHHHQHSR
jgi:hypothetical protein